MGRMTKHAGTKTKQTDFTIRKLIRFPSTIKLKFRQDWMMDSLPVQDGGNYVNNDKSISCNTTHQRTTIGPLGHISSTG
jgi:hypothetical protein